MEGEDDIELLEQDSSIVSSISGMSSFLTPKDISVNNPAHRDVVPLKGCLKYPGKFETSLLQS
jgi:hypothetical protein